MIHAAGCKEIRQETKRFITLQDAPHEFMTSGIHSTGVEHIKIFNASKDLREHAKPDITK